MNGEGDNTGSEFSTAVDDQSLQSQGQDQGQNIDQGQQGQQDQDQGQQGQDRGQDQGQQQQAKTQVEWTPEKIAEIAAQTALKTTQAQQRGQQQKKQLSPEELNRILNPVVFDENRFNALRDEDPKKAIAAYQALLNDTVKHATSVAGLMLEQRMREIAEYAKPMEQYYQQQAAEQQKQFFYAKYPALKPYEKFVQAAAAQVQVRKADGSEKSVPEVMDEIAAHVKDMLKVANVNLEQSSGQQQQTTHGAGSGGGVPRMTSMQQSGRSQASGQGGGQPNADADIYN